VPVAIAVFAEGGYSAGARVAFGVAALCGAALALFTGSRDAWREPVVVVLLALAALGALSALWTLGPVERTLRWALVCAGYAGVVVAAAAVARRRGGVELLAGAVAAIAFGAGLFALIATALHEPPYAEQIAGVWRPGGPFEYPPALALLEVSALPALLAAAGSRSRLIVGAGAAGLVVAGGVLVLAASRLALALAVVVVGWWLAGGARPRYRAGRRGQPARPRPGPARLAAPAAVLALAVLAGSFAFGIGGDYLHGRASTWRAALETFADRPLAGAGADAFLAGSIRHQHGDTVVFAHNLPLELAAELGIAGLLLGIALYAATASLLWRARATRAAWLLGPAAAAFLVASLLDWPWHLAGSGAIFALSLGALAGEHPRARKFPPPTESKEKHD
jgi:O-antigen ligase